MTAVFAVWVVGAAEASTGATEQVRLTVDAVIQVLKDPGLAPATRRQRVTAAIRRRFDFEAMSRGTLATHWKQASAEEKRQFVALFSELLENTYMGRIEAYTDERVEYVKERAKGKRVVVSTVIVTNVDIPVDYKLRRKGEAWLVYDVVIEGVSLIRNYRSSYDEIVRKGGVAGLLERMQAKVNELKDSDGVDGTK